MSERSIQVAVCAWHDVPAGALDACLLALAVAGVPAPIVTRAERGHGLAVARNTALAAASADVLAFLDADVLVAPDWFQALSAAWARGDDDVAAIAGPIGLHLTGSRPAWLGDALLGVLGVSDEPRATGAVDPSERTFPAGNLSADTAALRGVGGFWPARGRAGIHDWHTEDHHAQHELGRAGWRLFYDPAVRTQRRVDVAQLAARRLIAARAHSGARAVRIGQPRPSGAGVATFKASAGALLAATRRQPQLAVERAARGAEFAGALAPAILARDDLTPVSASTPFRHTVPVPQHERRWRRPSAPSEPVILCYHRVATPEHDPLGLCVSPANFADQLAALQRTRTIVPLTVIAEGRAPANAVAITFDDGYVDNLRAALPALETAQAPATVFIATGHTASGAAFWWDELVELFSEPGGSGRLTVRCSGQDRAWQPRSTATRDAARAHLHAWLQPVDPSDISEALRAIRIWAGHDADAAAPGNDSRPMTAAELRELTGSGLVTLGAHTRSHISLRFADDARLADELAGAATDLTAISGVAPTVLAYPFGVDGVDVDARVVTEIRRAHV